jgi:cell division septal protein FtsQ
MRIKTRLIYISVIKNIPLVSIACLVAIFIFKSKESIDFIKKFYNKNFEKILTKDVDICNNIEIDGNNNLNYEKLLNTIEDFCKNKQFDLEVLKNSILEDIWVRDVFLKKSIPNKLRIEIIEYYPFVMFFNGERYNLMDQFGNIIKINDEELYKFKNILLVSGDGFEKEINSFFNLLSIHDDITKNLYKIERIGRRRWNLILKNKILIKLPEEDENIFDVWNMLEKILDTYGLSVGLESIDLRIKDKVYLQYHESQFSDIINN